jgi:hypothetical protein
MGKMCDHQTFCELRLLVALESKAHSIEVKRLVKILVVGEGCVLLTNEFRHCQLSLSLFLYVLRPIPK